MKNKIKITMATILIVVFSLSLFNYSYGNVNGKDIKDFDEYLIKDMVIYNELINRKFEYGKSFIEDDWNIADKESIRETYRSKADGFYYDFLNEEIYNKSESYGYNGKTNYATYEEDGFYYVSRKRYTNPYMYGYGVILIIEKWNAEPNLNNKYTDLVGYTYFELKGDTIYQNGKPIFEASKKSRYEGYYIDNYGYPVVLTDIDYSVNDSNEHIITAVGLGFKKEQSNPDITSNYNEKGQLKVGKAVTTIYSMRIEPNKKDSEDYYNGYHIIINYIDGIDIYGAPYNYDIYEYERSDEEKTGTFKYIEGQLLPRLTNDIHDKSVNWLITEMSEDWLNNRIGYGWGNKPYSLVMQVDTMKSNKPQLISGYYQTYERFGKDTEKIQSHYVYLTNQESLISPKYGDDNLYSDYLKQTDGLSPYFIDKGFSHFRLNVMYMFERESNTAFGKKIRFGEQEYNEEGHKYIRPLANNGLEMRLDRRFIIRNKNLLGNDIYNKALNNNMYGQFYRNIVSEYPTMAYYGAYREYYNISINKEVKVFKPKDMQKYNTFYENNKDELNTKNIIE